MVSKFKLFALLTVALLTGSLSTNAAPTAEPHGTPAEDACILPPPSVFMVTEIGTSWYKATWTPVLGAYQYQIITRDLSGTAINTTYVPASVNGVTISGFNPGTSVVPEIRSVCYNFEQGPSKVGPITGIIVIDVVGSFYRPGDRYNQGNCIMQYDWAGGCDMTNDGSMTEFQITNGGSQDAFFRAYKNVQGYVSIEKEEIAIPFSFVNGGGMHINIITNGQNVARLTTSVVTTPGSGGQRRLYRCPINSCSSGNDDNYPIRNAIPAAMTQNNLSSRDQSLELSPRLSATPNPFADILEIQIPFANEENELNLALYDLQGRMMMTQHIANGGPIQTIETGTLPTGVYFLRVECAGKAETIKVVKTQ
jgi:hypothetical protein